MDLTSDDDAIRNIIAFAGSDLQTELQNEMSWVGDFPNPQSFPKLENGSNDDLLNDGSELAVGQPYDELLGNLQFECGVSNTILYVYSFIYIRELKWNCFYFIQTDGAIKVQFESMEINMPKNLYTLLLHFNTNPIQKNNYYDAKFVLIIVSSFIKVGELRAATIIDRNDYRLNFAKGKYIEFK